MREVESEYHPEAVQLSFSGNNLTPCMNGYALYTEAYYDKYRADTLTAIDIFDSGRTHVYLIGAPITKQQQSVPNWQMLNMVYAEIARADPARVTYVDAGRAVGGPGGTFVETLPCSEARVLRRAHRRRDPVEHRPLIRRHPLLPLRTRGTWTGSSAGARSTPRGPFALRTPWWRRWLLRPADPLAPSCPTVRSRPRPFRFGAVHPAASEPGPAHSR